MLSIRSFGQPDKLQVPPAVIGAHAGLTVAANFMQETRVSEEFAPG
jgi:hypothetical protein